MDSKLDQATEILKKHKQEQLLSFYDELEDNQKELLLDQLLSIDFDQMRSLYEKSFIEGSLEKNISHLPYVDKSQLTPTQKIHFKHIGLESLRRGEFAVITLSGGQRHETWTFRT